MKKLSILFSLMASASLCFAQTPLPIIDMHFHAANFDDNGPPPNGISRLNTGYPVYEADKPWIATFANWMANPQGENPIMAPTSNKELLDQNMEILKRRNIYAVSSGPNEEAFKVAGKERIYSSWQLTSNIDQWPSPEEVHKVLETGKYKVFGEVTLQYAGISPNDPRFAPYLVILEEFDIPLGIHIGTGPPGVSYFPGMGQHLARMHSAFEIEEVALRHSKLRINLMHAGWPLADHLIAVLYNHPQVYADVGIICYSLPREAFHDYLKRIVQAGFHRRNLFGFDQMNWPDAIEEGIKAIETADFLTEAQKRDILYNNAARFLRLSQKEIDKHHGK
ncbi:amidohydrolase family protein [Paucihalobacter sp.]|uniref:amidohydrolase family protein n=1 Tax=Paucihalobacter sp. TaxID=2850405 RepID=UPI003D161A17